MSKDELKQILKEISDDCYYRVECAGCEYFKNGNCILKGTPDVWDIGEED